MLVLRVAFGNREGKGLLLSLRGKVRKREMAYHHVHIATLLYVASMLP